METFSPNALHYWYSVVQYYCFCGSHSLPSYYLDRGSNAAITTEWSWCYQQPPLHRYQSRQSPHSGPPLYLSPPHLRPWWSLQEKIPLSIGGEFSGQFDSLLCTLSVPRLNQTDCWVPQFPPRVADPSNHNGNSVVSKNGWKMLQVSRQVC